jgi:hypothetical protein
MLILESLLVAVQAGDEGFFPVVHSLGRHLSCGHDVDFFFFLRNSGHHVDMANLIVLFLMIVISLCTSILRMACLS